VTDNSEHQEPAPVSVSFTVTAFFSAENAANYASEMQLPTINGNASLHALAAHVSEWAQSDLRRTALGDFAEVETSGTVYAQ
jgi:hypothetical protein